MIFVKIFVSLMILFVAVNLVLTIYKLLNRKWREGLENANPLASSSSSSTPTVWEKCMTAAERLCKKNDCRGVNTRDNWRKGQFDNDSSLPSGCFVQTNSGSSNAATDGKVTYWAGINSNTAYGAKNNGKNYLTVDMTAPAPPTTTVTTSNATKAMICPNGCTAPTELSGNCNSLEKDASGNYYKDCPYECTGEGCGYDQQCSNCGAFKITGLWDKNGNYIGQDEGVQKTAASTVAGGTRTVGTPDGTLDDDTAAAYSQAGGSISTPSAVKTATCDVVAIHNNSAHSSTYGQWFPGQVSKLNLSQTNYEHAGRKFLNEESIKKGIRTPLVMDSEAEVLGRLLWRVHLAAITQNCMKNTATSVTTTMNDELALMKKVHQIQNSSTESSISGTACAINTSTQPIQTANCPTTGMMTNCGTGTDTGDNRPGAYTSGADATNSINSTVPSVSGASTAYSTDYQPRNPNKKPKPYNSIWDIF